MQVMAHFIVYLLSW